MLMPEGFTELALPLAGCCMEETMVVWAQEGAGPGGVGVGKLSHPLLATIQWHGDLVEAQANQLSYHLGPDPGI